MKKPPAWGGSPPCTCGHTITLTLRHLGDANGLHGVDFADLLLLAQHYGQTGQSWATGDFNYDGTVNFADLLILAQNYGQGASPAAANLPTAASDSLDTGVLLKRRRGRA